MLNWDLMDGRILSLCVAVTVIQLTGGAAAVCGQQSLPNRNSSGEGAVPGEWPWHVSLSFLGKPLCGGSLISDSWIITAGHCFDGKLTKKDPKSWTIHLGFTRLGGKLETSTLAMTVSRIVVHEKYTHFLRGMDVALVELSHPVELTDFVSPVCLPEKTHRFHLHRTCFSTGLQAVPDVGSTDSVMTLHKVPLTLIGWRTCNCIYNSYKKPELANPTRPGMLCATESDEKKGPCLGDSGGPMVCNEDGVWFLAGVISFTLGCYLPNSPTVITAASFYQDWILGNVGTKASFAPQTITVTDDVDTDSCSDLLSSKHEGCTFPHIQAPASNGTGLWPWQVDVVKSGLRMCGGALISDSWVITAAHCFTGALSSDSPADWTVIVAPGSPSMQEISVQKISVHGAFISPDQGKDAALLQLVRPAPPDSDVHPACVLPASRQIPYGSSCWYTGRDGPSSKTPGVKVDPLRAAEMELISPNQCNCIYSHPSSANHSASILPGMMCASYRQKEGNQCLSDSGGPLVCQENGTWFLVGLRSFGGECLEGTDGKVPLPGVFTQLNTLEEWIFSVTNDVSFNEESVTPDSELDNMRCPDNYTRGCGFSVSSPGANANAEAMEGTWPWQVSVQRFESHTCSGALIAQTWVLTTARCITSYSRVLPDEYTVILGRQRQNGPNLHNVTRRVRRVITHPAYRRTTGENDLALVEVYYGVTFSDYIWPVCLPLEGSEPPSTGCWVTGWTNHNPFEVLHPSGAMKELEVSLLDKTQCGDVKSEVQPDQGTQLCATKIKDKGFTCLEESGSPLVCRHQPGAPWVLFGISSSVADSKYSACPVKYTPVSTSLPWIKEGWRIWITIQETGHSFHCH
uniref:Peptidase S1 domain-containing protein n=1 Tax=Leptobrachium leishanense TaxID=445787 RepID=A0A8C5WH70_9ANUR